MTAEVAALEHEHPPETVPALDVRDLDVVYRVRGIERQVLRGVTFEIPRGRLVRPRRRVRLRQVDGGHGLRPLPAVERPGAAAGRSGSTAATSLA